jgi:hypothetical protein
MSEEKTAADMKIFAPKMIECDIVDINGKKKHVTAKFVVTGKNLREMSEIFDEANKLLETHPERKNSFLMAKLYGGEESDYDDFELRVLRGAIDYFTDCNKNPM